MGQIVDHWYRMAAKVELFRGHCEREASRAIRGELPAQTLIEYAIIAALLCIALIAVLGLVANAVGDKFRLIADTLDSTTTSTVPTA